MPDVSHTPVTRSNLTTLSEAECFELLAAATVGRIGFVSPGGLQILPVNYRLGVGPRIFVKISPNGALAQLAELRSPVAFEVDYHADDFRIAWSVLMQGAFTVLDDEARAAYAGLNRPPVPWPGGASSLPVMFMPNAVSGRSLQRASTD